MAMPPARRSFRGDFRPVWDTRFAEEAIAVPGACGELQRLDRLEWAIKGMSTAFIGPNGRELRPFRAFGRAVRGELRNGAGTYVAVV